MTNNEKLYPEISVLIDVITKSLKIAYHLTEYEDYIPICNHVHVNKKKTVKID